MSVLGFTTAESQVVRDPVEEIQMLAEGKSEPCGPPETISLPLSSASESNSPRDERFTDLTVPVGVPATRATLRAGGAFTFVTP